MSGIYTVPFEQIAVTAVQDLLAVVAHASKQSVLLALHLSQTNRGGDAQEEILGIRVRSGQTTVGSGGSAVTPTANDGSGAASGFTARRNDTTQASAGTIVEHYTWNWNVRMPFDYLLPEQLQIIFGAGRRLTFEIFEAPSVSMTMSGFLVVQEIG